MSREDTRRRTRRSVLRTAGLSTAALGIGTSVASGSTTQQSGFRRARMYASDFYSGARFRVVSADFEYEPRVSVQEGESFLADLYWNDYETRIVRYANTEERVLFFPRSDAAVERGTTYRTGQIRSTEELADGVVAIGFSAVTGDG